MKHVGADDKIERAELEALFGGGFFKIKILVSTSGKFASF